MCHNYVVCRCDTVWPILKGPVVRVNTTCFTVPPFICKLNISAYHLSGDSLYIIVSGMQVLCMYADGMCQGLCFPDITTSLNRPGLVAAASDLTELSAER